MTRKQIIARAHNAVVTALRRGDLKRSPCEVCGRNGNGNVATENFNHAHHDDYSKPLEVRWLCGSCHKQHHLKFGPGKLPPNFDEQRTAA